MKEENEDSLTDILTDLVSCVTKLTVRMEKLEEEVSRLDRKVAVTAKVATRGLIRYK